MLPQVWHCLYDDEALGMLPASIIALFRGMIATSFGLFNVVTANPGETAFPSLKLDDVQAWRLAFCVLVLFPSELQSGSLRHYVLHLHKIHV